MSSELNLVFIILGVEHLLLVMKYFMMAVIPDMPGWVRKCQARVDNEKQKMMIEEAERDENEKIGLLKERMGDIERGQKEMMVRMKDKIKRMREDMDNKDRDVKEIKTKKQEEKKEEELKGVKVMQ